jgi:uncharacterized sulfatase
MNRQPDIVIVLSDQQRPDTMGVYGQELDTTPVLDVLAAGGTTFDRAFTVQPVCGPARASIQTGRVPTELGCWRNGLALPAGVETMATRLAALGYRTGYVGKWHLASDRGPRLPPGRAPARFEKQAVPVDRRGGYADAWVAADALELTSGAYRGHVWDEDGDEVALHGYRVDAVGDLAVDRLNRLADDDDRPFLLFVSFLEPHHQNDRFRTIAPKHQARDFRDFAVPGDLRGTLGDWRWNYAATLAACASIDANVGKLLDALRARGRFDDALIVYASDHGSHFRTRNLEYKRSCHDASIRVPLVVHGPGFAGGVRSDRLVTHLDLLPTVVTSAGGDDPGLAGRPLQQARSADDWRDEVLVQISESQIGRALRTATHTYAAAAPGRKPLRGHLAPAADTYVETHCYDLDADPFQRHNLSGKPATEALRRTLADRLAAAVTQVEGVRPKIRLR